MIRFFKKIIPKKILNLKHYFYAFFGCLKYKNPSKDIYVIGITGTSGKSTVSYILRQILEKAGYTVGALSTIEFYIAGEQKMNDKKMTMLGKMEIQKYLREMVQKKCDIAIIETTSEGALQHRHRFINYDMLIFTNLYPEHIESHGSFENYKNAKLSIAKYISRSKRKHAFEISKKFNFKNQKVIGKTLVINGNSEHAKDFTRFSFENKYVYLRNDQPAFLSFDNAIEAKDIREDLSGLHFRIDHKSFLAPLHGKHNISNLLCALAGASGLGISFEEAIVFIKSLEAAPGRIEFIKEAEEKGFKIIVDYAFEPVALKSLYEVVKLFKPERIIHVCGATGGGRDKGRRKPIGKIAGAGADIFIVTDEDPYDDDPMEIMQTVAEGAKSAGKKLNKDLFIILDRREAIKKAISVAKKGDLILITGKGSEQAMCVANGVLLPWDDRNVVREELKNI
jgi:UDP-N-acetylmuramoyl-L-alanyl-D-glutamate--2,6-diaminopimelate ligase